MGESERTLVCTRDSHAVACHVSDGLKRMPPPEIQAGFFVGEAPVRSLLILSLLAIILLLATPAWAEDRLVIADFSSPVDAAGIPAGWHLKEKNGKADFAVIKDEGLSAARLRSANTSFSLQKEVRVNLAQFRSSPGNGR